MFTIVDTSPSVYLVGITRPTSEIYDYLMDRGLTWSTQEGIGMFSDPDPTAVIEFGGRVCYASWDNAHRRTRPEYIQDQIVGKRHGSVLEHLDYVLMVADVPRSVQMETIRHRAGTAFSWESQRYVDKSLRVIVPPSIRKHPELREQFIKSAKADLKLYSKLVETMLADLTKPTTMDKKRAREAARAVLPNAMGSDGQLKLNAREARHFIQIRTDASADQSMREFAFNIYEKLHATTPAIFADATLVMQDDGSVPEVKFAAEKV